jgi:hypothetical protein
MHGAIRDTITRAMELPDDAQWESGIRLLNNVSDSITTTLFGELGGPVPPDSVLRLGLDADADPPSPWNTGTEGFIGVWDDEKDDGDMPPRSIIKGRSTGIVHPAGVTFTAREGEVIAPDAIWNGLFTFLKPELFTARGRSETER